MYSPGLQSLAKTKLAKRATARTVGARKSMATAGGFHDGVGERTVGWRVKESDGEKNVWKGGRGN